MYYSYIFNLNPKNMKLINQLFFRGFTQLKDFNNKYTVAFFLQVLSLSINLNNNLFPTIISKFNINCLKISKLPNSLNLNNIRPNFELLLKIYANKDIKNDVNIGLKLDTLISFCNLILYDKSALKFINDSPYKNGIISNIISKIDFFNSYIFNKDLLNILLLNCNKNNFEIVNIISKSLNFADYIELIYENIDIFKNIEFKLNKTFQIEKYGKSEEMIPKIFTIIKNCKNLIIDGRFIINKFPNFIDILSLEEREELYKIIKN